MVSFGGPVKETGVSKVDDATGWTPKPTEAPGTVSDSKAVLELLRRNEAAAEIQARDGISYTWTNSKTCGWYAGMSCKFALHFAISKRYRMHILPEDTMD
jgi:hypothetical protein